MCVAPGGLPRAGPFICVYISKLLVEIYTQMKGPARGKPPSAKHLVCNHHVYIKR